MSAGEIVGLLAVIVFAILVALLSVPIIKFGKVLDQTRYAIKNLSEDSSPLIHEVTDTVSTANQQLKKVDNITDDISDVTANVSALAALLSATVGTPMVKVAAFTYGVRNAIFGFAKNKSYKK